MAFHLIDMATWPRAQQFQFFTQVSCVTYAVTANIDIARFRKALKAKGYKLTPALTWAMMRVINAHQEFRTSLNEKGELGYYDVIHPWFPIFHPETENFSLVWTEYKEDFGAFYDDYMRVCERYADDLNFLPIAPPPNTISVSSATWLAFTSFTFDIYRLNGFPFGQFITMSVTIGKYVEENDKLLLPVAVQVHHSICDAVHVGRFYAELQALLDDAEAWLG